VQGGVERTLMDGEKFLGDLAKALRDGVAVIWSEGDNFEDQHVQRAAKEFAFGLDGHSVIHLEILHIRWNALGVNRDVRGAMYVAE
jgi:hypothetical protein